MAIRKQKEKLLGWGGMGITTGDTEIVKRGRHEKVVVFSNCFTVEQVMKDPTIIFKELSLKNCQEFILFVWPKSGVSFEDCNL